MLNYISEVLNINCSPIDMALDKIILPLYLDLYEIQPISLDGIKVLGNGNLDKKLTVRAHRFTQSALEKIEKSGSKAEVI